jgi:isopentenyldiphosphate isomerase/intracellular septation protein A
MNLSLLKKLLPGLIPLLIFIIADEIWGTRVGLFVALATGIGELGFYWFRDRKIDSFIILDTALLLVLGGVSIVLENDIFFKIKPALIELILLVIIAFSLWGPRNIIMAMSQRYMGEMELDEGQEKMMRINMLVMFWITVVHIILVIYSAEYLSKEAWAFISGGLYYILFGIWFAGLWGFNKIKTLRLKNEEWFPVVNEDGTLIGRAPRRVCHDGKSKLLHPVVHLHIFNKEGKLFLQKRSANKDIQPGKWDTSVGGHISPGESVEAALHRETIEEAGLKDLKVQFIHKYVWESSREKELVFSFITVTEKNPVINREEIDEGRFWGIDEIASNIGKDIFTPNFEHEFNLIKEKSLTAEVAEKMRRGR